VATAPSPSAKKAANAKKATKKNATTKKASTKKKATTTAATPRATDSADARLAPYRRKRDFSKTSEPSGSEPPREDGRRFVVQRHRARRLHYDLRLEAGGVLVSWAVPKGPTLDPGARHLAVHVEDHPLDYFDFEGTIPEGEYGGGDVIVWDWGTWSPARPDDDPLTADERGDLHVDLHGEKLAGRFVLVRRGRSGRDWLLLHKRDDHAVPGWDPEEHPASVKSGRTNDEVAAAPDAVWNSNRASTDAGTGPVPTIEVVPATAGELDALDALGKKGTWHLQGRQLRLTNLDKVLFPAGDGHAAVTKRELIRYYTVVAPAILPYLAGRPVNSRRFPDGITHKGFWQKAVPTGTPDWVTRWRNTEADPDETQEYVIVDSVPTLALMANYAAVELNPWTSLATAPHEPTWALIDIDPGEETTFDEALVLARLYRTALDHLGVRAAPKVTGKRGLQIWLPVARGYTFDDTRRWVEAVSRAVGRTVPDLVSWEWEKRSRGGKARLDYTQNAINKTLVAPFSVRPEPGAPVSVTLEWEELDDPGLAPDRWTIATAPDRLAAAGDPLAPLVGLQQQLPPI
jgi:bifunctional non-homologous end joining protein LigD